MGDKEEGIDTSDNNSELPIGDVKEIENKDEDFIGTGNGELFKTNNEEGNIIIAEEEAEESPNQILYTESDFTGNLNYSFYTTESTEQNTVPEEYLRLNTYNNTNIDEDGGIEEAPELAVFLGNIPTVEDNQKYLTDVYYLINEDEGSGQTSGTETEEDGNEIPLPLDEIVNMIKESPMYEYSPILKAHVYLYEAKKSLLGFGDSGDSSGGGGGILGGITGGSSGGGGISGEGSSAANTPFGGRITQTIICTCSANTLVYVQDVTKGVLPLIYQPGVTKLYSNYNVFTTGANLLGTYTPGAGICLIYSGDSCNTLNSTGMMNFTPGVGTSRS